MSEDTAEPRRYGVVDETRYVIITRDPEMTTSNQYEIVASVVYKSDAKAVLKTLLPTSRDRAEYMIVHRNDLEDL